MKLTPVQESQLYKDIGYTEARHCGNCKFHLTTPEECIRIDPIIIVAIPGYGCRFHELKHPSNPPK